MTHKALIRRLQISCLGLDAVDPLRLLVDDVVAALTQPEQEPQIAFNAEVVGYIAPQRTWVGLTKEEVAEFTRASWGLGVTASEFIRAVEARVKEKNNA